MSILWQIILIKSFIDVSYQRRPLAGTKFYVSQWWFLTAILLTLSNFFFNFSTPVLFWLLYSFSHILNGRHKCHFCGATYATKQSLKLHITNTHVRNKTCENIFKCQFCDKSYSSKNSLNNHINAKHWQERDAK